jgi:exodeoxyribonuclease V alpha subunit
VPGIGERRVAMIERAWAAQKAIKDVMLFLRGHDVSIMWNMSISSLLSLPIRDMLIIYR